MHVTIRSSFAKGKWSFLHPNQASYIRALVPALAKQCHVQLYRWSQNSNHLHMLIRAGTRGGFKRFLRVLSSRIAQRITGSRKGKTFGRRFFDFIPFTRIIEWGRDFKEVVAYVYKNTLEATGLISYTPRKRTAPAKAAARSVRRL